METLNYNELTYPEYCGKLYGLELAISLQEEKDNPKVLPQSAFKNNRARGKALSHMTQTKVDNFQSLAVLLHREIKHDEKTPITEYEKDTLERDLSTEEIDAATYYAQSFWVD